MITRKILEMRCPCGKMLSDQEMYLLDLLEGMCQECYDNSMDAAYEEDKL
jgi:hypothetical protein